MKISKNWLSEYVDLPSFQSSEQLADFFTQRGLEVDSVEDQSMGFEKVITAKILKKQKHPNADRLNLCVVDFGGEEKLSIVCGAQNFKQDDIICLAQIGAVLPNGMTIKKGKIRGEISEGMICSEAELGISDESDGILVLPKKTPVGKSVAKVLNRNDIVFELSITPNRGDCLSYIGIAREVVAATGGKVRFPKVKISEFKGSLIKTDLNAGDEGRQFFGLTIEGVQIGPSPDWLVERIESIGSRSINNVVDATNFVMFEMGQPMHAYDLSLLNGDKLSIRRSKKGEKLKLLDDTEIELQGFELVIADAKNPVALAGVMGGENSEVGQGTKTLFLECAEFDPIAVRRAALLHKKHTDASHRFERGIDPDGLPKAISRLADVIIEVAGGKKTGGTAAFVKNRNPDKGAARVKIKVKPEYFSEFLGIELKSSEIKKYLNSLGCKVMISGSQWIVLPPAFRWDLNIKEDLAEEVGRSIGYDRIKGTIPALTEPPHSKLDLKKLRSLALLDQAKDSLKDLGFQECIHYGFGSKKSHQQLGFEPEIKVLNPMNEAQEVMVCSLLPHLIESVQLNWNHHFGSEMLPIRLFEIRPTFFLKNKSEKMNAEIETGIKEKWKLSMALSGLQFSGGLKNKNFETGFFEFKGLLEGVFERLGSKGVRMKSGSSPAYLHPGISAEVQIGKDSIGFFGRIHPNLEKKLKLKAPLFVAELDWEPIVRLSRSKYESKRFKQWSEFPPMERDFALVVKKETPVEKITQLALKSGRPLAKDAKIFDIYEGQQVAEGMTSIAVRVIFSDEGRSLRDEEADQVAQKILAQWKKELGAELRG